MVITDSGFILGIRSKQSLCKSLTPSFSKYNILNWPGWAVFISFNIS